jgi:hypothetical protein
MENKPENIINNISFNSLSLATLIYNTKIKNDITSDLEKKINTELIILEKNLYEKIKNELMTELREHIKNDILNQLKDDWECLDVCDSEK